MNQLNNIIIEGTVINTPEVVAKNSSTGHRLIKMTIVNDRYYRDTDGRAKQDSLFIVVQCWGELGEKVLSAVDKGLVIRIVGRLTMTKWETKSGEKRNALEIVASHIEYRSNSRTKVLESVEAC